MVRCDMRWLTVSNDWFPAVEDLSQALGALGISDDWFLTEKLSALVRCCWVPFSADCVGSSLSWIALTISA